MATVHKSQRSRPVRNAVVGTGRLSVDGQKEASNGYVYKEDQVRCWEEWGALQAALGWRGHPALKPRSLPGDALHCST